MELTEEELDAEIGRKLRMEGVVNSAPEIVDRLDRYMETRSDVIPVEKKKDGSFSARSSVLSSGELQILSRYVSRKVAGIGREILEGNISLSPCQLGSREACTYCSYKRVCGFEAGMPGCEKRRLEELDGQAALERMERETEEEAGQ